MSPNSPNKRKSPKDTSSIFHGTGKFQKTGCNDNVSDSREIGRTMMAWMIDPVEPEDFEKNFWQKQSFVVRRNCSDYYNNLFSMKKLDKILRKNQVYFGKNIDVTSYKDGERSTLNPSGRASASMVWENYQDGCSVRMLNPQTFCTSVWKLCSRLQEYLRCFVGANVYLTPAGTQGFAPHWDDIDAFVLQLEGKKRWRVYKTRDIYEKLPLESSQDFKENELPEALFDGVLNSGDMLYIPRGMIHQANALESVHSMHITLSSCQHTTWSDLLKKLLSSALDDATDLDVSFRESLPLDYCDHLGVTHAESKHPRRQELFDHISTLVMKLVKKDPIDAAADQMVKQFIHDSLPPHLNKEELKLSTTGHRLSAKNAIANGLKLDARTGIRFIRRYAARLVCEEDTVRLYYSLDNSLEYHGVEAQFLEVSNEEAECIELLTQMYPKYIKLNELEALDDLDDAKFFAMALLARGIIQLEPSTFSQ